ncbi:MAG: hypothetical protein AAF577_06855 [Pseudomonadota bacterium]
MSTETLSRQACLDLVDAGEDAIPNACAAYIDASGAVFDERAEVALLMLGLLAILIGYHYVNNSVAARRQRSKVVRAKRTTTD